MQKIVSLILRVLNTKYAKQTANMETNIYICFFNFYFCYIIYPTYPPKRKALRDELMIVLRAPTRLRAMVAIKCNMLV